MSERKATPGPWEVDRQTVYSPKPRLPVAFCGQGMVAGGDGSRRISEAEAEANAALIGSSLVMLSALKAMDAALTEVWLSPEDAFFKRGVLAPQRNAWLQIRSAIARADGRGKDGR